MLDSSAVEGIDTRLTRAYARGERAPGKVPGHWQRLRVIGALGLDGMTTSMSIAAAANTWVFLAFIEQVLIPALQGRPDAIVVMDTAAAALTQARAPGGTGPSRSRGGWHRLPLPARLFARPEPVYGRSPLCKGFVGAIGMLGSGAHVYPASARPDGRRP